MAMKDVKDTYRFQNGISVLSVAYGLRDMGTADMRYAKVRDLLEYFRLQHRSNKRVGTCIARNGDTLDDFDTALGRLDSADFKVDRNIDFFVGNRAARKIIKGHDKGNYRKALAESYVIGKAFGYPQCCVLAFVDGSHVDYGNDYVPWHPCGKGCKPSARFEKKMRSMIESFVSDAKVRPCHSVGTMMSKAAKLP